jgi:hypothetical protein
MPVMQMHHICPGYDLLHQTSGSGTAKTGKPGAVTEKRLIIRIMHIDLVVPGAGIYCRQKRVMYHIMGDPRVHLLCRHPVQLCVMKGPAE